MTRDRQLPRVAMSMFAILVALLALTLLVDKSGFNVSAESAAGPMFVCPDCNICFPSCTVNDSRMMSLSGGGLESFVGGTLEVGFTTPGATPSITIGVFDADSRGPLQGGLWDQGSVSPPAVVNLKFEVFADPSGTGVPTVLIDSFESTDAGAVDNDWWDHTYDLATTPNFAAALTPSGNYSFVVRISVDGFPPAGTINGFKLRTNRNIALRGQSIQMIAKASFQVERDIIYPGLPPGQCPAANQPTTYDGSWEFSFNVAPGTTRLDLWDGEMDFGSADGSTVDTDDPNTPPTGVCVLTGGTPAQCAGNPDIPLWAQGTGAVPEGAKGMGDPPDDNTNVFPGCLFTRSPSVTYRLIPPSDPFGGFVNNNPSGTEEWERFLISSDPADAGVSDYQVAVIEPGMWRIRIDGMDVFNQFTMHFTTTTTVVPVTASIGDTVFSDTNANGTFEPGLGETGIGNVTVDLLQGNATCTTFSVVGTRTTNANGNYLFTNLQPGCYRVTVTDTNGVLTGLTKTIGPNPGANNNSQVDPYSVTIAGQTDNLTADFGYVGPTCNLKFPGIVKARPRASISFIVSNPGLVPATVSVRPLFGSACFILSPGSPQKVTIGAGQSAVFALNALNCPINARQFAQNSYIVIESSTCPPRQVQVEWVLR